MSSNKKNKELKDAEGTAELRQLLEKVPEGILAEALAQKVTREDDVPGQISEVVRTVAQEYSGPIPPPVMLEQYDKIEAGFANRIISMAENEQKHRHELESSSVNGAISKDRRGQHYALVTSLALILGCVYLISSGYQVAGTLFGGFSLTTLAYIFVTGRRKTHPETPTESD